METILSASGEVKDPAKTIPKSLFIAMGGVLFFYVSIQLISQSLLGNELAASKTPLADGIGKYVAPLGLLLLFGATMSRVIWVASSVLGAPRILFAMARDGNLPKILGLVHAKNSTPHVAIWVHVILGILLALSGTFEQLAVLSGRRHIFLYLCCSLEIATRKHSNYGHTLHIQTATNRGNNWHGKHGSNSIHGGTRRNNWLFRVGFCDHRALLFE
jgi:amino acid transporter